ncbi:peptide deformylase [Candidatus Saccharibacteria bacterium RIFCSPHIGHO2_01_FULL_45_15]|nr:MAG: peptide deformylase [Candidatus Saccharibacteria bacterium RIFCSPHIGHO2_01_FULL_45_15]
MILKIVQAGDTTLRKKAKQLTRAQLAKPETQQLIDLMIATLRDRPGVGLAAPQVGESLRIIIIEDKTEYHEKVSDEMLIAQSRKPVPLKVIVNPVLTIISPADKSELYFEGCLSVDGYAAVVPRARAVKVTGWDRHGKPLTVTADGWFARILQHEVDHLNGDLYIDTMISRTFMTDKQYSKDWAKASPDKLVKFIAKTALSDKKEQNK